ncbi:MFS transporter [Advenella sp. FME57]|uniref:MFS transporter n=1 Tax=Advenella sp. FME57 TaxID=2742604 RepID=UPI0018672235|nr:MFS transporter [Advenella sp. FME57]
MRDQHDQLRESKKATFASSQGKRAMFNAAAYTLFVLLVGTNIPTPLYRSYEQVFNYSPLVTTLIFATYVAALVPALLIAGPLSDAIGRRRVLLPSLALAILGSLAFATASGVVWLFVARILQGLAVGGASGALTAMLSELEPEGNRRRATLVTTVASLGGLGAGPLIAGLLAQYAPLPYVLPFMIEVIVLIPALMFVLNLPEKPQLTTWHVRRPIIPQSMRHTFATRGLAIFLAFSVIGLFLSLVPAYVMKLSETHNLAVAGGAATLMLTCSVAAQVVGYGKSPLLLQIAGLAFLSTGLGLLGVAGSLESLPLMGLAAVMAGVGHGLTFLGGFTEINRQMPVDRHAEIVSSFYIIVYLGVGVPVIGVGLMATTVGSLVAIQRFTACMIPLLLVALCILVINRQTEASIDMPSKGHGD